MSEQKYCPSCGVMVDTIVLMKGGGEEIACHNCAFVFKVSTKPIHALRAVLTAEDSPVLLRKVAEMLEARQIARTVITCKNGEEFIEKAVSRLRAGLPISMAILDITMPILNGVNAAIALRAIERGVGVAKKIPVLFFTANKCDANLKKVLSYCAPAHCINKGTGSSPEEFADRIYNVIAGLLQEQGGKE